MVIRTSYEPQILQLPSTTAFAQPFTSPDIPLNNYKVADILLTYGLGETAQLTVSFQAKAGESGEPVAIPFWMRFQQDDGFTPQPDTGAEITVGQDAEHALATFRVTADMLASLDADRVQIKVSAFPSETVAGALTALLFDPRYDPVEGE